MACLACHHDSAATATPLGMSTIASTPGIPAIEERSTLATFPSKTGHVLTAAKAMFGTLTSIPNTALPLILAAVSVRFSDLPISFHSDGLFNLGLRGGLFFAAAGAKSAKAIERPVAT